MKITPLDIRRKEFKRSVRGYSDEEVDIFLDEVADEFERLFQENVELQEKMHRLDEQIAGHTQLREALEKTLISAQLQAEELRANAHKESELILRDAEMKAREIVSDSYGETQKTQQALVQLKMLEEDFRFKFRSLLEGYLRLLNEAPMTTEHAEAAAAASQAAPAAAHTGAVSTPATPAAPAAPVTAAAVTAAPGAAPVRTTATPVQPAASPAQPAVPATGTAAPAQPTSPVQPVSPPAQPVSPRVTQPMVPQVAKPVAPTPVATQAPASLAGTAAAPAAAAGVAPTAGPGMRPVVPPAQRPPFSEDETPTEESDLPVHGSSMVPGYYGGGQALEPTAEAAMNTDTAETFMEGRGQEQARAADDEPLRRFFFGRRMNDVDDTFQTEDVPKKDKNREFEW